MLSWSRLPLVAAFAVSIGLIGCASAERRPAVPFGLSTQATVVGFPAGVRYFPRDATDVKEFERDFLASNETEKKYRRVDELPPNAYLAISGGGDNGAFGAGLLNGWTKAGTRPEFKLVTGVSTGALIAPFAFLGPAYDEKLKALYTGISMRDVAEERSLLSVLYNDALADNAPLQKLVKKSVTQDMLDAIAAEHEKGRILLVATTNLDVRRPVIWNITEIAATRAPGALELVHKILIASAAIPGTFPPVMIDVEAGGKRYQEMHVDGGTASQVFVYPSAIKLHELAQRDRTLYLIRNARMDPEWAQVDRRTLPISLRAITCLIHNQGIGDLYRIYAIARRDHIRYKLTYIPDTFQTPHPEEFDTAYMRALFALGEKMAVEGHEWYEHPPVLLSGVDEGDEGGGR
ncbi:MAG TPA: patatin-like phospholipase family protein [Thermoanaerobaculia bacterium]